MPEPNCNSHNRLVAGSIPAGPTTGDFPAEEVSVREMLLMLLGTDGRRKLRLRHKSNAELFQLYDAELVLKHRSGKALYEARRVLAHFRTYLGEYPASPELAVGYLAQYASCRPASLYRYLAILKGFMSWYGEPVSARVKVPEPMPRYIESDEVERLKAALRDRKTHKGEIERNLLLVDLACKTGLRRGEMAHLRVADVDLVRNCVLVVEGKGGKSRVVDLAPGLSRDLRLYCKGKPLEDSLFGLSPSTISGLVKRAADRAGVDLHTHSLRHFFGERLLDTGTDLEIVRRLMGHSNLRSTQVYLGRSDKQRREAINRLEAPTQDAEAPEFELLKPGAIEVFDEAGNPL